MKSDPDSSHILLDSIAVPDNLSDKLLARWCMLSGKVADTLYTDLPYVQQLLRAQAYYKSHGTKQEQAKIGLYLGRSYVEDKENEKAMKVYLQALDIALRSEDYNQAGYICSYMGDLYDFEGNYLLGKDKYKEAESYFRKAGNMRSSAFALRDVGRMYAFSDSLDIALIFLLKADTIIVEVGDSSDIGTIYNGIGNIYNMLGNKELAKLYLWKNVNMSDFDDAPSYRTLAGIYIEEGDFKNARICLEKASVPSFNDMTRFSVLYGYSLLEKAEGNWEKAWFYLDEYNSASDSILTIRNRENIIKIEKEYEHLKISLENMRLKSDKQKYFIYWVISVSILLILLWVFQIRIDRKNKRLLKQEIDLSNKSNELFRLRDNLRNKQDRLEALSIQLSEKNEKLNELDSREKLEKEYEQIKKEEETLVLRIAERRKDLFLSSAIAKKVIKLSQKVVPGATKSPLSEKDWQNIITQVNEVYPFLADRLAAFNLSAAELRYCYLSLLGLDSIGESILLHIQPDSVNKRRQRVRQRLGIIAKELDLCAYLINSVQ
ncbi:tetratricopeptide repeat protein [Parabacteroides sp. 20_3]|nr:tetratricopeptide repeat protein [Parabacteroides sp. 20_3]